MCSAYSCEDFTGLASGELGFWRTGRLRRHLADCATCRADWHATADLWTSVRGLEAAEAPVALRERIARHLEPVTRAPGRTSQRRLLGTLGAAAAAVVVLSVWMTLRAGPAFADVLEAMQGIRTATWVENITESHAAVEYRRRERVCARLDPPALSRTAVDGWTRNGHPHAAPQMISLQDARGIMVYFPKQNRWDLLPGWGAPGGGTLSASRKEVMRNLFGPEETKPVSAQRALPLIETSKWEGSRVELDGHTLYRFHKAYGNPFSGGEETIWADPETRRIVRREVATRKLRDGKDEVWRSVAQDFRYNNDAQVNSLDLIPPPGTLVQSEGFNFDDQRLGLWDRLPASDRDKIIQLTARVVSAWGNGDYAAFASEWDFDHTGGLPRVSRDGKMIIQTAEGRRREWRDRLAAMRRKPVSARANVQNIIALKEMPTDSLARELGLSLVSLPPDAAGLLLVPTVVQCPLSKHSSIGSRGFFYLRRSGDNYKVIRWDSGW